MNYIDYANQFWKENCRKRFQSRETALFFFLLNECSRNYWVMPVICSTEYVCCQLLISKQTLYAASVALFVSTRGNGGHNPLPIPSWN